MGAGESFATISFALKPLFDPFSTPYWSVGIFEIKMDKIFQLHDSITRSKLELLISSSVINLDSLKHSDIMTS